MIDQSQVAAARLAVAAAKYLGREHELSSTTLRLAAMDLQRVPKTSSSSGEKPPLRQIDNADTLPKQPSGQSIVSFDNVTKIYHRKARPALDSVTFDIQAGDFVVLSGPSGAGKSTVLRLIRNEERATSGEVYVEGVNVAMLSHRAAGRIRRDVGIVTPEPRLLPHKNVFTNVAYPLVVFGKHREIVREMVPAVLKSVGLEGRERSMPDELTVGEQQRLAIARAIVNRPKVLLVDEPTTVLDPMASAGILELLEKINFSGVTVVLTTPSYEIANQLRRPVRVIALRNGVLMVDQSHRVNDIDQITQVTRGPR